MDTELFQLLQNIALITARFPENMDNFKLIRSIRYGIKFDKIVETQAALSCYRNGYDILLTISNQNENTKNLRELIQKRIQMRT